jgi:DNA adenine methylase
VHKPLRWHGGKHYLTPHILRLLPRHHRYVELFFGSGAVLFARDPADRSFWLHQKGPGYGVTEVVNDLNHRLMNFYTALRDEVLFARFQRMVEATLFGPAVWEEARRHVYGKDPVADAWAMFVLCRQSRQGLMKCPATPIYARNRRGMEERSSAWLTAVEELPEVLRRLRGVVVECMPAVELLRREEAGVVTAIAKAEAAIRKEEAAIRKGRKKKAKPHMPGLAVYMDPPYVRSTRTAQDAYGEYEMSDEDHRELLDAANACVHAKVLISGKHSGLYDNALKAPRWQAFRPGNLNPLEFSSWHCATA